MNLLGYLGAIVAIAKQQQYNILLTDLSKDSQVRITTRQNIQLHWVRKKNVVDVIKEIAKSGFFTINGCGDNTRSGMVF